MKYVAAFDPGKSTGVAIAIFNEDGHVCLRKVFVMTWEERHRILEAIFTRCAPDLQIICEDFHLYRGKSKQLVGSAFEPVQVIGALKVLHDVYHVKHPVVMYPAAARKKVKVLERHRKIVGSSPHTRDAYQHLRYWCVRRGLKLL